jgi:hypothetical protein
VICDLSEEVECAVSCLAGVYLGELVEVLREAAGSC